VSFPFEYLPLPKKSDIVKAVGRDGNYICDATVLRVVETQKADHTPVVTLEIPVEHVDAVRSMQLIGKEIKTEFKPAEANTSVPDDLLVCRCEEISAGEIRRAIRDYKGTSVTEAKRRARCGMGLCQGKSCGKLVTRIISEELGLAPNEIAPATDRPPVRPITFGELAGGFGDE
jgi:bacterioferritin-associated ferredoxin